MEIVASPEFTNSKELEEELIPTLQKIQAEKGYISRESIKAVAEHLRFPESRIYGVATFYTQFRFTPPARHTLRVCMGTACHVGSGEILSKSLERLLGIHPGQTSSDGRFELQQVSCLGCCAQAPVLQVDDRIYGQVSVSDLNDILSTYE
jgi:NADH-quinone oxidoreductase subunit E